MSTTPCTRNTRGRPASVSGRDGNSSRFAEPQKRRHTAITNGALKGRFAAHRSRRRARLFHELSL